MKEATNELASLISFLNLGSEEMPVEEYVQLVGERLLTQNTSWVSLVDLAWGREIHLGLDLHEEPMEGDDVDDQPTPIVKLPQAREYDRWLSNLQWSILRSFSVVDVTNMQFFGIN